MVYLYMFLNVFENFMFLSDGLGTKVNEEGITYYNNLINSLLEKGPKQCVLGFLPLR